jgi:hypothetical protein
VAPGAVGLSLLPLWHEAQGLQEKKVLPEMQGGCEVALMRFVRGLRVEIFFPWPGTYFGPWPWEFERAEQIAARVGFETSMEWMFTSPFLIVAKHRLSDENPPS